MCGRFTLTVSGAELAELFGVPDLAHLQPRYNVAPGQLIATVRHPVGKGAELAMLKWGLIPAWAKDPGAGARMINARAETVAEKPAFRSAFRQRRCLIPADGFYEWQKMPDGKQAWLIRQSEHSAFGIAGLWESWQNPDGATVETCTLLTTSANQTMQRIHHRMPVMLPAAVHERWLDPENTIDDMATLCAQTRHVSLSLLAVSQRVNSPANDDAACLEAVAAPTNDLLL